MSSNNILVVKLGGGAGLDLAAACADLAEIARSRPLVVVHGVSERMAQLSQERGMAVEMLQSPGGHSSRYTPPPVRDLFVEAAGQISREIVDQFASQSISAAGLLDDAIIQGERKTAIRALVNGRMRVVRDDYSGSITGVNTTPIFAALERGQVAVVPPLAASDDGLLNIDGDRGAAAVAAALGAEELVILTNVRGLYRSFPDENSFVAHVPVSQLDQAMNWAQGRMKRKVLSAQEALSNRTGHTTRRVIIGDGRVTAPVSNALQGQGTVFTA
jgi:acetylglutamate/LysW-gamma-L-alpha-aminoadipate kinase